MLELPIHRQTRIILVGPHYPENLGACARALKTMGFTKLGLVNPSRLAVASHEMARKMAVKSLDVLDSAQIYDSVEEAIVGVDTVVGTSARRGISGIKNPDQMAQTLVVRANERRSIAILFGNEKSGLNNEDLDRADLFMRIPIAADQPSLNLAQAVQVVTYQLFLTALNARGEKDDE
jgi:TrmH family RNA methyltransferase